MLFGAHVSSCNNEPFLDNGAAFLAGRGNAMASGGTGRFLLFAVGFLPLLIRHLPVVAIQWAIRALAQFILGKLCAVRK